jgi:hypothetical protein
MTRFQANAYECLRRASAAKSRRTVAGDEESLQPLAGGSTFALKFRARSDTMRALHDKAVQWKLNS